jgi:pimeloyl-ACP methyl ester carboxylesterase
MQNENVMRLEEVRKYDFFFQSKYWIENEPATCTVEAQIKFTALLMIPLAFFVEQVAIAQIDIIRFGIWNGIACFLGSFPILVAGFNRELETIAPNLKPPKPEDGVPIKLQLPNYGKLQSSEWRGWRVCHTQVEKSQSAPTVILIHGFGGSIGHWRQNIFELAKHCNVCAIDLLGFGASDKPDLDYSIDLWVEQTYDFWKEFVDVPVILVGNSIGSVVCLSLAAAHPEMVRGVAMISLPDLSQSETSLPSWIRPLMASLKSAIVSPWFLTPLFYFVRQNWVVRRWARLAYACTEAITDELLEILIKPALEQNSVNAFCSILKAMMSSGFSPNIRQILGQVKIPLLLLWGKQDRMIPIALAGKFLGYSPNLELVELDEAGHCAHDDRPEQVNGELLSWIDAKVV